MKTRKIAMQNLVNAACVFCFGILLILGCGFPKKSFLAVGHGCMTKNGEKIALSDFDPNSLFARSKNVDEYGLVLDGKTGKIIWKDTSDVERMFCTDDNSVVAVSEKGLKWVDADKEIVYAEPGVRGETNFIGMTDANTVVRESRPYYHKKLPVAKNNDTEFFKTYKDYPTFLIDKPGETTRSIKLTEADLPGVAIEESLDYYFQKDQILIETKKEVFALDLAGGKTTVKFNSFDDYWKSLEKEDKYYALNTVGYGKDGFIEIYEGRGAAPKLVNRLDKQDLDLNVIHIIDCCNNGLVLLYWGKNGNSLEVAKFDHLSGKIIWKSENLIHRR